MAGEALKIAAMLALAGAAIWLFDWIERDLPDAIPQPYGDVPNLPGELRTDAENAAGGAEAASALGHASTQINSSGSDFGTESV